MILSMCATMFAMFGCAPKPMSELQFACDPEGSDTCGSGLQRVVRQLSCRTVRRRMVDSGEDLHCRHLPGRRQHPELRRREFVHHGHVRPGKRLQQRPSRWASSE
jgi:hypothetical protein